MEDPQNVDNDLYGRGFDGVHGTDAEVLTKRQAILKLQAIRDAKAAVKQGEFVEYDLYGRGDPRIFGTESHTTNMRQAAEVLQASQRTHKKSLRAVMFPAGSFRTKSGNFVRRLHLSKKWAQGEVPKEQEPRRVKSKLPNEEIQPIVEPGTVARGVKSFDTPMNNALRGSEFLQRTLPLEEVTANEFDSTSISLTSSPVGEGVAIPITANSGQQRGESKLPGTVQHSEAAVESPDLTAVHVSPASPQSKEVTSIDSPLSRETENHASTVHDPQSNVELRSSVNTSELPSPDFSAENGLTGTDHSSSSTNSNASSSAKVSDVGSSSLENVIRNRASSRAPGLEDFSEASEFIAENDIESSEDSSCVSSSPENSAAMGESSSSSNASSSATDDSASRNRVRALETVFHSGDHFTTDASNSSEDESSGKRLSSTPSASIVGNISATENIEYQGSSALDTSRDQVQPHSSAANSSSGSAAPEALKSKSTSTGSHNSVLLAGGANDELGETGMNGENDEYVAGDSVYATIGNAESSDTDDSSSYSEVEDSDNSAAAASSSDIITSSEEASKSNGSGSGSARPDSSHSVVRHSLSGYSSEEEEFVDTLEG